MDSSGNQKREIANSKTIILYHIRFIRDFFLHFKQNRKTRHDFKKTRKLKTVKNCLKQLKTAKNNLKRLKKA